MNSSRTQQQQEVVNLIASKYEIDTERILFLNENKPEEPWFPAEELMSIARQAGGFQAISEQFDQFIPNLNQVVHIATVVDAQGRTYSQSGVATMGESLRHTSEVIDEHALARSRALSAALRAAGFYPLRAGSVINLELDVKPSSSPVADETEARNRDLRQIHVLAERKGLIREGVGGGNKDMSGYRTWLTEAYGTHSAATLNPVKRKSVINALNQLPDAESFIA